MKISRNHLNSKKGFTLPEILIVLLLTGILMAAMASTFTFWSKSSVALGNYSDMNMQSRRALDYIARDIRMASRVTSNSSTALTVEIPGNTAGDFSSITYEFNADNNELTRDDGTTSIAILRDVQVVEFTLKNLQGNVANNQLEAKLVQIFAKMTRKIINLEQSDEIITASFVMRNKRVST